jgi:DNA-binding NarL/FixJ family response regulator
VSQTIRLLIADDHPVVRDGLRGIFEASGDFEVAGEAANGREAVDRAAALRPDVVLMDLRMPVLDGVSAIKLLAEKGIGARVLVLTTFDTDSDVVPAIEAGATGYLLKDSPPDELLRGVRAAARGEAVLSPSVATRLIGQVRQPAREPLSQRELDILELIAQGCSNREAAARCSSARLRSRPTCCISTPSSASTTGPPRWRRASSGACCPARELPGRILRIAGKAVRKECR